LQQAIEDFQCCKFGNSCWQLRNYKMINFIPLNKMEMEKFAKKLLFAKRLCE
jgi:hypothetical protein